MGIPKYTLSQVKLRIESTGCKMLTEVYNGNKSKVHIQCVCGKELRVRYAHFLRGHHCRKCGNQQARVNSMIKFGVPHPMQSDVVQDLMKKNNFEKYGVDFVLQLDYVKEKGKQTMLNNYGVVNILLYPPVQEKARQSLIDRFGGSPFLIKEIHAKATKTTSERYDVKDLQAKAEATNLIRYGVRNAMQNAAISEKSMMCSLSTKQYILPSGKSVPVQGYEPYALDLLFMCYNENDIITSRKDIPTIFYCEDDGKYHRYYPDMYIPSENLIIEVKSLWTYMKNFRNTDYKRKACEYQGFTYKLLVFDCKTKELIF